MTYEETTRIFEIQPPVNYKAGQYKIAALLTDSLGASRTYSFNIEVITEEEVRGIRNSSKSNNNIIIK